MATQRAHAPIVRGSPGESMIRMIARAHRIAACGSGMMDTPYERRSSPTPVFMTALRFGRGCHARLPNDAEGTVNCGLPTINRQSKKEPENRPRLSQTVLLVSERFQRV